MLILFFFVVLFVFLFFIGWDLFLLFKVFLYEGGMEGRGVFLILLLFIMFRFGGKVGNGELYLKMNRKILWLKKVNIFFFKYGDFSFFMESV